MTLIVLAPLTLLALAALCDLRWRVIPNSLCAALAVSGALWTLAAVGPAAAAWAALAALAVFAAGAALFALGAMGGGDVKLAAAVALWLEPAQIAPFLVLTALTGAGLGVVVALARLGARLRAGDAAQPALRAAMRAPVPYGVAIAAGGAALLAAAG